MPWVFLSESELPDYHFLASGNLEFLCCDLQYRQTLGVNAYEWASGEWHQRLAEFDAAIQAAPGELEIAHLYQCDRRFRHITDRLLALNHIEASWLTHRQIFNLLCSRKEGDRVIEAPLRSLNAAPEPRHPIGLGGEKLSDRASFLAALSGYCGGNFAEAIRLAKSAPAREVLQMMDDLGWWQKPQKAKDKAIIAEAQRKAMDTMLPPPPPGIRG